MRSDRSEPHRAGFSQWIVALFALVMALVMATPAPTAAQTKPKEPRKTLPKEQVAPHDDPLGRLNLEYRRLHRKDVWGPTPGTVVATVPYVHNGERFTITVGSVGNDPNGRRPEPPTAIFDIRDENGQLIETIRRKEKFESAAVRKVNKGGGVTSKHAELLAYSQLLEMGVDLEPVSKAYIDVEPCLLPGSACAYKTAEVLPNATIYYGNEYGGDPSATTQEQRASRERGLKAHKRYMEQLYAEWDEVEATAERLFSADGNGSASGPLVSLLGGGQPPPGGIDFTSLQLRYIADGGPDGEQGLTYSLAAGPTSGVFQADRTVNAARQASDAFFVWLSLSPDKFWVNLSPNEPDRIIDEQFGRTHAGRILLEADLKLKKTVGRLIHPDSKLGRKYWKRLRSNDNGEICVSFRQWIVPKPAVVRDDGTSLTILDAPLDVKLESEYIEGAGGVAQTACAPDERANEEHNEAVFRELILPRVRKAVNKAPEYADLRRVYTSRVAAEWYGQRSLTEDTAYRDLVGSGDISNWQLTGKWSPRKVFDKYVDSYRDGEFNVTQQTTEGNVIYESTYVYGGVDFSVVPLETVGADDELLQHANLPETIERSITEVAADDTDVRWLGAVTNTAPEPGGLEAADGSDDARRAVVGWYRGMFVVWLGAVAMLLVLYVMLRRRKTRGSSR